jgi:hypothetical protein
MFATSGRRQQLSQGSEEPAVDPRDIDKILSEIAGMLGRWTMFKKFLLESLGVGGLIRCPTERFLSPNEGRT